jgi:hypothetical protein
MNKYSIITIIAMIFALNIAFADYSDYAYLINVTDVDYLPNTIYPGDTVSLALTIRDRGTITAISELNANIDLDTVFEGIQITDHISEIAPNTEKTIVFKFKVDENTTAGYYPVKATFNYLRNGQNMSEDYELKIPVNSNQQDLSLIVTPNIINPGNEITLKMTFENKSNLGISNINISWEEENNLILPLGSDNKRFINYIPANSSKTVEYLVASDPNITPGIYSINTSITYNAGDQKSISSTIGILVGGETDFEISAEYLNNNEYSISVANIGTNDAESTMLKIPKQNGITITNNEVILGSIDKGDFTIASFTINKTGGIPNTNTEFNKQKQDINFSKDQINTNNITIELYYTDTTGKRQKILKEISLGESNTNINLANTNRPNRTKTSNSYIWYIVIAIILILSIVGYYKKDFLIKIYNQKFKRGSK